MQEGMDRTRFMALALIFEGSMVLVALVIGWIFHLDVFHGLRATIPAVVVGVAGAIAPFVLLLASERWKIPAIERIKILVVESLGPSLVACNWFDIILLALVAGIGEEVLFRGAVQPLLERWTASLSGSVAIALILSNVIFGLLHCVTPTYALLAGLMGVYFGLLLDATGSRNLLGPILAHGLYDYLAFLLLIRAARQSHLPSRTASQMRGQIPSPTHQPAAIEENPPAS
jgi:uncharacterized protein